MGLAFLGVLLLVVSPGVAADVSPGGAARQWRQTRERAILDEFTALLRIPNVRGDMANLRRNARFISGMFARRGASAQILEIEDAPPLVYAELPAPGATETLIFYGHYDGEPVQPSEWYTGDPFQPTLISSVIEVGGRPIPLPNPGWPTDPEWRLYARSASDGKADIIAIASALDALRARGVPIRSNLKFLFDGEREAGSPHIERYLRDHAEQMHGDLLLYCDGTIHQNGQQQIIFGVRGKAAVEVTVYGPRRDVSSEQYANWVPDPAMRLTRLLASLEDEDGGVLIEGFYDEVVALEPSARRAIAAAPDYDSDLRRELWLAQTEGRNRRIEEAVNQPGLTIHRLASGAQANAAGDLIPSMARVSIGIHLVKGMDHRRTVDRLIDHIRGQGFFVVENEPGELVRLAHPKVSKVTRQPGYNAVRTSMDLDISRRVTAALEHVHGPLIRLPSLGDSWPLHVFEDVLGAPVIIVPIANYDSNRHDHNENIRLQNLWDGIESMAALLALPPPAEAAE